MAMVMVMVLSVAAQVARDVAARDLVGRVDLAVTRERLGPPRPGVPVVPGELGLVHLVRRTVVAAGSWFGDVDFPVLPRVGERLLVGGHGRGSRAVDRRRRGGGGVARRVRRWQLEEASDAL